MPITQEELEQLNTKGKLVQKSKKTFGETFDCREAGYILEDGSMLDLSGKSEGGTPKTRNYDHREICRIIDHAEKGINGTRSMDFFERKANAIRFGLYGTFQRGHDIVAQLNTYQTPTEQQLKRIVKCCKLFEIDALNYDIHDNRGNLIESKTIDKPDCTKAVNQMKKALDKAKKEMKDV